MVTFFGGLERHKKGADTAMRRRMHASEKALKQRGIRKALTHLPTCAIPC